MTMAAATTAATAMIYRYTYTLGRSLYVPITSRCNSVTLPSTRGPSFLLPRSISEALARFRTDEVPGSIAGSDLYDDWELEEEDRVSLPRYNLPLVNGLYGFNNGDISRHLEQQREMIAAAQNDGNNNEIDDMLQPSIATLVDEVSSRLDAAPENFDQVVIAGEGEPTLRMDALLAVARRVKSYRQNQKEELKQQQQQSQSQSSGNDGYNKRHKMKQSKDILPVRVITNGLCYGIPNLGYSPQNTDRSSVLVPMHRHVILKDMIDAGITRVSVALNTANRHEYDVLMEPSCHTGGGVVGGSDETEDGGGGGGDSKTLMPGMAHDIVCEFVMEATKLGMDVEITGVDRPEVDKTETERLARLLLSVAPRNYGRGRRTPKVMRWRRYFD